MVNIRGASTQNAVDSPRGEVGEIDTRAPFQSVKAAVSLFGEVAVKRRPTIKKTKSSSENVLDKETQLLLAQREINRIKHQLEGTEATKTKALADLEKAKRTVQDLTTKLNGVIESKQLAIEETEAIRSKAKHLERVKSQNEAGMATWKKELDITRDEYRRAAAELNTAKQELTKIRQDFDATLESKLAAFQQAAEAQRSAKANAERASQLSKDIETMQKTLEHLKATSAEAQKEQARIVEEKDARLRACQEAKEEAQKKLQGLRKEHDPEITRDLEVRLAETTEEIEVIQEEMKKIHASDTNSVHRITKELNEATKTLEDVAEEESAYRKLVDSLGKDLEDVKKERTHLEAKGEEAESTVKKLQEELDSSKEELQKFLNGDETAALLNGEQDLAISAEETERAIREAEEMRKMAEELRQEAQANRELEKEAERKLEEALKEAEAAKTAERSTLERMQSLSGRTEDVDSPHPVSGGFIKMAVQDFESLTRKVEESENLAEMKLAAAAFQMEAVNTKKKEADKRKEAILKEIEEMKEATDMALKQAEMAEAAKNAIEGELKKRRQQEEEDNES